MKRLIVILMALILLCGCGAPAQQEATAEDTLEAAETQAPTQEVLISLYDADSEVEQQTQGALRAYPLGDGVYTDLQVMGEKLLVLSESGDITVLQGQMGQITATVATDLNQTETGTVVRASGQGVGYYVPQTREVVLLDSSLLEIARLEMPEGIQGIPVILFQRNEVFFCEEDQIRAMDIQTGISRLVRSHACVSQELTGSYFDDTVLGCRITDEQGARKVIYLYADTGKVMAEELSQGTLYTNGMEYFALRGEGEDAQLLFGSADGETMCLETDAEGIVSALPLGGAVRCSTGDEGLQLEFYEFATGTRSAALTVAGLGMPKAMAADENNLWFIVDQTLYCWDLALSQTGDETGYVSLLYTQETPDTQGLARCQSRVEELEAAYGIDIQIWTDAVSDTGSYACQAEHRVSATENGLDELEQLLKQLPEGFIATTGNIRVSLVRSVNEGDEPVQYWQGNVCNILVPSDMAAEGFLWGLGYGIDARVLGNSRDFDDWDDLNPRDFEYTYDYAENAVREDAEDYLDDFVDKTAMSFPTEDRARVFMAAMLADNAELFAQDTLQDKLLCLCEGIREAYNLEDSTTIFLWEQYLEEPIAAEE